VDFGFRNVVILLGYYGRTDNTDWADLHGFFDSDLNLKQLFQRKIRVNPPNLPNPFSHSIPKVSPHSQSANPHSEIRNPKSKIKYFHHDF
jgi:hypothetical protein